MRFAAAAASSGVKQVTDHVRQITGREPVSFSDFVRQHLAELIPSMHAKPFVFRKKENFIKIKSRNIPVKTSTNKTHQKNI